MMDDHLGNSCIQRVFAKPLVLKVEARQSEPSTALHSHPLSCYAKSIAVFLNKYYSLIGWYHGACWKPSMKAPCEQGELSLGSCHSKQVPGGVVYYCRKKAHSWNG